MHHNIISIVKPTRLHFTEPEGSLPHSQASTTCLYPGPAQSSPYTHIPPPEFHPNIIHPSTPGSPLCSPSLRFSQQDPTHPPLLTHMRHMPSPFTLPLDALISQIYFGIKLYMFQTEELYETCGLVVRVSGYRYRGPGLDPRRYQIF